MSRVGEQLINPDNPQSIVDVLGRVQRTLDREVEFGTPQDPTDDQSVALAGSTSTSHPGTLSNIRGSWVELEIMALHTPAVTCYHNLELDVPVAGEPNVRWLLMGFQHTGAGASGVSTLSCNFQIGDSVTSDSIDLRFYANSRTVSSEEPLQVSLFFVPAVRWPT